MGEVAEGFEGDDFTAMRDGDRGSGERVLGNRVSEDGKRRGKDVVLMLARKDQKRRRTWNGTIQSGKTS